MNKLFYQPPETYHATERLSKTGLDRLNLSPAHYQAWLTREEEKVSPAMVFGGAYHCKALEPHLYPELYAAVPSDAPSRASKVGKTWWQIFDAANASKTYLKDEDELKLTAMVKKLRSHSRTSRLLEGALLEYSCYTKIYGVETKCKPDVLRPDLGVVADLKSAVSAAPDDFSKACANFRYHVQAAYYLDQINAVSSKHYTDFLFIVQEKSEPYGIKIYRATEEMLGLGRVEYTDNLLLYKECVTNNHWPGYDEAIEYIDLPGWYVKRKELD